METISNNANSQAREYTNEQLRKLLKDIRNISNMNTPFTKYESIV